MTGEKDSFSSTVFWISIRVLMNMMVVFLLVEGFVTAYHFSYKVFADMPYKVLQSDTMNITIAEGSDAGTVASVLQANGIVESQYIFLARVHLGKYQDKIRAGTYTLGPGMTPDEICQIICGVQSEDAT